MQSTTSFLMDNLESLSTGEECALGSSSQNRLHENNDDDDVIEVDQDEPQQTSQDDTLFVCFWCDCQFHSEEACRRHIDTCHEATDESPTTPNDESLGVPQSSTQAKEKDSESEICTAGESPVDDDVVLCSDSQPMISVKTLPTSVVADLIIQSSEVGINDRSMSSEVVVSKMPTVITSNSNAFRKGNTTIDQPSLSIAKSESLLRSTLETTHPVSESALSSVSSATVMPGKIGDQSLGVKSSNTLVQDTADSNMNKNSVKLIDCDKDTEKFVVLQHQQGLVTTLQCSPDLYQSVTDGCISSVPVATVEQSSTNNDVNIKQQWQSLPKRLKCAVCSARFCHLKSLENHVSAQHNPQKGSLEYYASMCIFACDICDASFSTSYSLSEHLKDYHRQKPNSVAEFPCLTCDSSFYSFEDLKKHMTDSKHEFEWFCFMCDRSFPEESALRVHFCPRQSDLVQRQITRPMFVCSICSKIFRGPKVFAKHINHCSFSEYCARCSKHSLSLKNILEHTKECGLGTTHYFCSSCDVVRRSITFATKIQKTSMLLKRVHCRCCGRCFSEINTEFIQHETKCEINKRNNISASTVVSVPSTKVERDFKCNSCNLFKLSMTSLNYTDKREVLLKRAHCTYCGKCFDEKCDAFIEHEERCRWNRRCASCECARSMISSRKGVDKANIFLSRVHCKICGKCFSDKSIEILIQHEADCRMPRQHHPTSNSYTSWKENCKLCKVFELTINPSNTVERSKVLMKRVHCKFCGKCFNERSLEFVRHESKCKVCGHLKHLSSATFQTEGCQPSHSSKTVSAVMEDKGIKLNGGAAAIINTQETAVVGAITEKPTSVSSLTKLCVVADKSSKGEALTGLTPSTANVNNLSSSVVSHASQTFVPVPKATTSSAGPFLINQAWQGLAPTTSTKVTNSGPSGSFVHSQAPQPTLPTSVNPANLPLPGPLLFRPDSSNPIAPNTKFLLVTYPDGSQILFPLAANFINQVAPSTAVSSVPGSNTGPIVLLPQTQQAKPPQANTVVQKSSEPCNKTQPISNDDTIPISAEPSSEFTNSLSVETLPVLAVSKQIPLSNAAPVLAVSKQIPLSNAAPVKQKTDGGKNQMALPSAKAQVSKGSKPSFKDFPNSYKTLKEKYFEQRRAKYMSMCSNTSSVWRCALCTVTTVSSLGETCIRCKALYRQARSEQSKKTKSEPSLWYNCCGCSDGCVPVKGGRCGGCMKKLFGSYPVAIPNPKQTREVTVIVREVPRKDDLNLTFLSSAGDELDEDDGEFGGISDKTFKWCPKCGHCFSISHFYRHPCKSLRRHMQSCFVVIERMNDDLIDENGAENDVYSVAGEQTACLPFVTAIPQSELKMTTIRSKKVLPQSSFERSRMQQGVDCYRSVNSTFPQNFDQAVPACEPMNEASVRTTQNSAFVADTQREVPLSDRDSMSERIHSWQQSRTPKFQPPKKRKSKKLEDPLRPSKEPYHRSLPSESPEFMQFVNKLANEETNSLANEEPKKIRTSKSKRISLTGSHKLDKFIGDLPAIVPTHYCELCNSMFDSEKLYVWHLRTHDEYRPFPCSYCGCRFKRLSNLLEHIRFYHMRGQVPCYTCGKRFANSLLLRKHTKSHTGHYQFVRRKVDPLLPHFEVKKLEKKLKQLSSVRASPPEESSDSSSSPFEAVGDLFTERNPEENSNSQTSTIFEQSNISDVNNAHSLPHIPGKQSQDIDMEQCDVTSETDDVQSEDSDTIDNDHPRLPLIIEIMEDEIPIRNPS